MAALQIANDTVDTAKRQQILDGARQCFLARGFDGASMNDIVKAAGVSKGTVYAYFPSKDKLFEALISQDRRRQAEQALVIEDDGRPIAQVLQGLGLRMVRLISSPESIAYVRMVVGAVEKFPHIGQAFFEAGPAYGTAKLADYFERQMQAGTLRRKDARLAAMQFIELISAGLTKPKLFASETIAGNYGAEIVVASGVELFLAGMAPPVDNGNK
jgi:AcrR family transcriptional regulator